VLDVFTYLLHLTLSVGEVKSRQSLHWPVYTNSTLETCSRGKQALLYLYFVLWKTGLVADWVLKHTHTHTHTYELKKNVFGCGVDGVFNDLRGLLCIKFRNHPSVHIPDGVIGIFHWHNPSGRNTALGSTRSLREMSKGVKLAGA
jgi:hypothetical protein